MDRKLLLIKGVTLLFRESQIPNNTDNSAALVRTLLEGVILPDVSVGAIDTEREILAGLKQICIEMCSRSATHQYVTAEILQKIHHATRHDETLYNSFRQGIEQDLNENDLKRFCLNLEADINEHVREDKITRIMQEDGMALKFKRDQITNMQTFVADHIAKLEPFQVAESTEDPGVVSAVNFANKEEIARSIDEGKSLNSSEGILKLGHQGLNRMTEGGLRRGEFVTVAALQHNFKTGMSLNIFESIALYNTPHMVDPKKKPLLLRITFEDPLSTNITYMYRNIYENKNRRMADVMSTTTEEMVDYVYKELTATGYEIMMIHVNPSEWTYRHIINKVLEVEAQGYEVHVLALDYLAMVPTTGCKVGGPTGSDIRDMFRRMRNFCGPRKITCITPHQLSTEAKKLTRMGNEENFVKDIANKGYYDSCSTIDQEIDLELYIHIVKSDGGAWLTVQRGKHRGFNRTPEAHKYCVLKFEDVGDIIHDINGQDLTRKRPGGGPIGSAEENPVWMFDEPSQI